jgi:hypothetical protein
MRDFRNDIRVYFQPAFLICVAVLTTAAAGMSIAIKSFGVYLKKEPLPLKKSFDLMDESDLSSYKVISKHKIENEEVITALGTEDYIQWILEDTEAADNSPAEKFMLFITYYRLPDRVPHVPEECSITLEIDNNAGFKRKLRAKYLVFGSVKADLWRKGEKFPVLYLFKVNGEYAASREEARIALNKNLFRKYSYFCKVELVFNQTLIPPNKEQAIKAGEKLLSVILPVLEAKHWPDW